MKFQIWANCSEHCDDYEVPRMLLETDDPLAAILRASDIGDQLHWVEVVLIE